MCLVGNSPEGGPSEAVVNEYSQETVYNLFRVALRLVFHLKHSGPQPTA